MQIQVNRKFIKKAIIAAFCLIVAHDLISMSYARMSDQSGEIGQFAEESRRNLEEYRKALEEAKRSQREYEQNN